MPGIPPTPDIFDSPGISLCLNSEWASFIEAQAGKLLARGLWEGTDSDIDRAIGQIELFLNKLADVKGACALTPVGGMMMWGAAAAPDGWLKCDGSAISRATYADLFAIISTTYGAGNGTTTFNLPNLVDKSPMGAGGALVALGSNAGAATVALSTSQLPAHSHGVTDPGHAHGVTDPGHAHLEQVGSTPAYLGTGGTGRNAFGAVTTSNTTRVTTDSATTGASVNSNTTGITTNNAGLGQAHGNLHPVIGLHVIIFAGV